MSNCINYGCDSLGTHSLLDCDGDVLGGVPAVLLLECNHQLTDPSNAAQVQAEIDAGRATLVKGVKYSQDAPSPVTVPSAIANQPDKTVKYDVSGTYVDKNVNQNNIDFYGTVNSGRSFGGLIFFLEETQQVVWIDEGIRFSGGLLIPDSNSEMTRFEGAYTYNYKAGAEPTTIADAPAGIFN